METSASQQLFLVLLKASVLQPKSLYYKVGIVLDWDLNNKTLTGTFTIPLTFEVDLTNGKFNINSADFLEESPPS